MTKTATARRRQVPPDEVLDLLRQIVVRLDNIEADIRLLRTEGKGAPARDAADLRAIEALSVRMGSAFLAADALADSTLAAVLRAADITEPREVGHLLDRFNGRNVAGRTLEKTEKRHARGHLWRFRSA